MKVWIAIRGVYDDKYVAGVYLTEERAVKAMTEEFPGVFEKDSKGNWQNDRDWEDHVYIYETDVDE